jgi:DNA-binding NtrC family response regulator
VGVASTLAREVRGYAARRRRHSLYGAGPDEVRERGIPEDGIDLERLVAQMERFLINKAAEKAGGNQSLAARYLHVNRDKLRTRMKNHRLDRGKA